MQKAPRCPRAPAKAGRRARHSHHWSSGLEPPRCPQDGGQAQGEGAGFSLISTHAILSKIH